MGAKLIISSRVNNLPYKFNSTGISVYSIEEALYHCRHYWRECIDETCEMKFISWLDVVLKNRSIKSPADFADVSDYFLNLLTIIPYFDDDDIDKVKEELEEWRNLDKSVKYKEKADRCFNMQHYEKAIEYYRRAEQLNPPSLQLILNNIALCFMRLKEYDMAVEYYGKAYELDKTKKELLFNYVEALIFDLQLKKAMDILDSSECPDNSMRHYYIGEVNIRQENYSAALNEYIRAYSVNRDNDICIKICDIYMKQRRYSQAMQTLIDSGVENTQTALRKGRIYAFNRNYAAAVKCIETALENNKDSAELWAELAKYYRLDYDFEKAEAAAAHGMKLENGEAAAFEYAKTKKAQGKLKDYQFELKGIIQGLLRKYRSRM